MLGGQMDLSDGRKLFRWGVGKPVLYEVLRVRTPHL